MPCPNPVKIKNTEFSYPNILLATPAMAAALTTIAYFITGSIMSHEGTKDPVAEGFHLVFMGVIPTPIFATIANSWMNTIRACCGSRNFLQIGDDDNALVPFSQRSGCGKAHGIFKTGVILSFNLLAQIATCIAHCMGLYPTAYALPVLTLAMNIMYVMATAGTAPWQAYRAERQGCRFFCINNSDKNGNQDDARYSQYSVESANSSISSNPYQDI